MPGFGNQLGEIIITSECGAISRISKNVNNMFKHESYSLFLGLLTKKWARLTQRRTHITYATWDNETWLLLREKVPKPQQQR